MASPDTSAKTRPGATTKPAAANTGSKTKRRLALAGVLLLILLMTWYAWPQSDLDHVRQMREELFATPRDQMSPEERKEKFAALRAEEEKLSAEDRQALRKEMGQRFQKKRNAEA